MSRITPKIFLMLLLPLVCLMAAQNVCAREITDMTGRTITIPDAPQRVYTPSPPGGFLLFTLNPDALCGLLGNTGGSKGVVSGAPDPRLQRIPNIGSLSGEGRTANLEVLMRMESDLIVMFPKSAKASEFTANESMAVAAVEKLNVPYVFAYAKDLSEYPAAYEFIGEVMGVPERGQLLGAYIQKALDDAARVVAQVPAEKRPGVYYAGGVDGLTTVSQENTHGAIFKLLGDVGVHKTPNAQAGATGESMHEKISFELVLAYNPDVIVVMEPMFFETIYTSPQWQQIRAVQNKRVLLVPRGPLNWVDRPPSFMGALGLKWLLAELYPEQYPIDIVAEAVEFYRLFLWSDIPYAEMRAKIYPTADADKF